MRLRAQRPARRPVVAVINSNDDLVAVVRETLEDEGFNVTTAHIHDFKTGREDLPRFLSKHEPDAIVYDLAPPYDDNWRFLRVMRKHFGERPLVLTTVNRRALERTVGRSGAYEIEGRRADLSRVVRAVLDGIKKNAR